MMPIAALERARRPLLLAGAGHDGGVQVQHVPAGRLPPAHNDPRETARVQGRQRPHHTPDRGTGEPNLTNTRRGGTAALRARRNRADSAGGPTGGLRRRRQGRHPPSRATRHSVFGVRRSAFADGCRQKAAAPGGSVNIVQVLPNSVPVVRQWRGVSVLGAEPHAGSRSHNVRGPIPWGDDAHVRHRSHRWRLCHVSWSRIRSGRAEPP